MHGVCTPDRCQTAAWPLHKNACIAPEPSMLEFLKLVCQLEAAHRAGNTQDAIDLGYYAEGQYKLLLERVGLETKARLYEHVCVMYRLLGAALCVCGLNKAAVVVYSDLSRHYDAAGKLRMKCGTLLLVADLLVDDDTERASMLAMLRTVHNTSVSILRCNELQSKSACAISHLLQRAAAELLSSSSAFAQEAAMYTFLAAKSQVDETTAALQHHVARAEGDNPTADAHKALRKQMAENTNRTLRGVTLANADAVEYKEKYHPVHAQALQFAHESLTAARKMTAEEASVVTPHRLDEANALVCLIECSDVMSDTFDESLLQQLAVVCTGLHNQPDSIHEIRLHMFHAKRYGLTGEYTLSADACREALKLTTRSDKAGMGSVKTIALKARVTLCEMWKMELIEVAEAEQTSLGFAELGL